jgi:hypothetical protein
MKYFFVFVICVLFFSRCEFKNEEDMEATQCDTLNITYVKVAPIFQSSCVRCHNETTNYYGIKLNSYQNVKDAVGTGLVIKAINHEPGVEPMPFQLPKLEPCNVRKITIWINNGAPEEIKQ